MKIRCEQNSLRLRLRKSEMADLNNHDVLRTALRFPDGKTLGWELRLDDAVQELMAEFAEGNIVVRAPRAMATAWMANEEVGLEAFQNLPDGGRLQVLVEKDFPCKDRPEEDKSDFFTELAEKKPPLC